MNTQITRRPLGRTIGTRPGTQLGMGPGVRTGLGLGFPTGFEHLFDGLLGFEPFSGPARLFEAAREAERSFAIDLSETDTEVIVRASLPGYTAEQIDAEVHDDVLTIRAVREESTEESAGDADAQNGDGPAERPIERWIRRERRFGSVVRQVPLPVMVDEDKAVAKLVNGELELRLPKIEDHKPRKIRIGS